MQINLLVRHVSPKPLDKEVVDPTAVAVHTDAELLRFELFDEFHVGEPVTLVCVEYFGVTFCYILRERQIFTKCCIVIIEYFLLFKERNR